MEKKGSAGDLVKKASLEEVRRFDRHQGKDALMRF